MEWKVRRRVRDSFLLIALGLVSMLAVAAWEDAIAQTPKLALTVRPREMATATRNAQAGEQTLDGKPQPSIKGKTSCGPGCWMIAGRPMVYVPQQCVGARRCPLVIISNSPPEYYYHIADKYGMIVALIEGSGDTDKAAAFDQGLQQVLRTFAIDPDKIAIMGRCATGQQTVDYADANPNVFSRVVVGTQHTGNPAVKAPNQTTEYLIAGGLLDGGSDFWGVQRLRDRGYTVANPIQFRRHSHTYDEYDFMGRWLQQSWAVPNPAARPVPHTFGDPSLLTAEGLAQMTAFWTRFMKEPDSIKTTARRALTREVLVPVGRERILTLMVDMPALAARYPSVAAALTAAKLTPQQHEAYQAALASTLLYQSALNRGTGIEISADSVRSFLGVQPNSAVTKDFEFLEAHRDELSALEATEMWDAP